MAIRRIDVPGSQKKAVRNARIVSERPGDEEIVVTIRVRRKEVSLERVTGDLTAREYAEQYGASAADLDKVTAFAAEYGLKVIERDETRRRIAVRGTVADMQAAFGTHLQTYQAPGGEYRGRVGAISVPAALAKIVVGVFGLDNRIPAAVLSTAAAG